MTAAPGAPGANGHGPTRRELLATLAQAFGPVEVIAEHGNGHRPRPPALPAGWVWEWRPVSFGRCVRCPWPANTLGPDARPWHAFCWAVPDAPVPAFDRAAERRHYHKQRRLNGGPAS